MVGADRHTDRRWTHAWEEGREEERRVGWAPWSDGSVQGWMVAWTDGWMDLELDDDDRHR